MRAHLRVQSRIQPSRRMSVVALCAGLAFSSVLSFSLIGIDPSGVSAAPLTVLQGGTAPVPPGDALVGPAPSAAVLHLEVTLQPRDPSALAAAVQAVSTPGSSEYRDFLQPGQFAQLYGPTPGTIAAVTSALEGKGLTVGAVSGTGLSLPVTATVAEAEAAFSTPIAAYLLPSGTTGYDNADSPSVPSAVAPYVQGVLGLDTLNQPEVVGPLQPTVLPASTPIPSPPAPNTNQPQPTGTACISGIDTIESEFGSRDADELAQAYSLDALYADGDYGANTTVALVEAEESGYSTTDIDTFANCYGITLGSNQISFKGVDGATNSTAGDLGESELDIETVLSLAPAANIDVYLGVDNLYNVYSQIESDDTAKIVSSSWSYGCEAYLSSSFQEAEGTLLDDAALQGQSIFAASGDTGSQGCNTNGVVTAPTGDDPVAQAIDPSTGTLYIANEESSTVSIDSEQSFKQVTTAATLGDPTAIAFDPTDDKVFVVDSDGSTPNIAVFSASTCNSTQTSGCPPSSPTTFGSSSDLAYVTSLAVDGNTLYVGNSNSGTVTVFDATTDAYEGTVTLPSGDDPDAIAIGPSHVVYVADDDNGAVDYFSGSTCDATSQSGCGATPSTVTVGSSPSSLAYDSSNGDLYVGNLGGGISVINTSTNSVVTTIATDNPPAFDSTGGVWAIGMSPTDTMFSRWSSTALSCPTWWRPSTPRPSRSLQLSTFTPVARRCSRWSAIRRGISYGSSTRTRSLSAARARMYCRTSMPASSTQQINRT